MVVEKKIDIMGRFVIPKDMRNAMDLAEGDRLYFVLNEDNSQVYLFPFRVNEIHNEAPSKKIDNLGRILVPEQVQRELGMVEKDRIYLALSDDKSFFILTPARALLTQQTAIRYASMIRHVSELPTIIAILFGTVAYSGPQIFSTHAHDVDYYNLVNEWLMEQHALDDESASANSPKTYSIPSPIPNDPFKSYMIAPIVNKKGNMFGAIVCATMGQGTYRQEYLEGVLETSAAFLKYEIFQEEPSDELQRDVQSLQ